MTSMDLAYAKMLLAILEECNRRLDCSDCKNSGICSETNIPNETAYWFGELIKEVEKNK